MLVAAAGAAAVVATPPSTVLSEACGAIVNVTTVGVVSGDLGPSISLASPNTSYNNGMGCGALFQVPAAAPVSLTFLFLDTEASYDTVREVVGCTVLQLLR